MDAPEPGKSCKNAWVSRKAPLMRLVACWSPVGGLFTAAPPPLARLGHPLLTLDDDAADVGYAMRIRNASDPPRSMYLSLMDMIRTHTVASQFGQGRTLARVRTSASSTAHQPCECSRQAGHTEAMRLAAEHSIQNKP